MHFLSKLSAVSMISVYLLVMDFKTWRGSASLTGKTSKLLSIMKRPSIRIIGKDALRVFKASLMV